MPTSLPASRIGTAATVTTPTAVMPTTALSTVTTSPTNTQAVSTPPAPATTPATGSACGWTCVPNRPGAGRPARGVGCGALQHRGHCPSDAPPMLRKTVLSLLCAAVLVPLAAGAQTLLQASRIHTSDPDQAVAQAMVWDGDGRIVAVGEGDVLKARFPHARVIDLGDATIVPGLIDAHAHIVGLGTALTRADLVGTRSKQQYQERRQRSERDLPPGAGLIGRAWDQNDWPVQVYPTAADLDAAFPERPVWLGRVDGHAGWVNSAVLRAIAADPAAAALLAEGQRDGGLIVRDAGGRPTGVFVDEAERLVAAVSPDLDQADADRALELALAAAVRQGLTGLHDMGTSLADFQQLRRFADAGRLPLRISAYADGDGRALAWLCANGAYAHPGKRLQMRGVKFLIDGALGSRGAAMAE